MELLKLQRSCQSELNNSFADADYLIEEYSLQIIIDQCLR